MRDEGEQRAEQQKYLLKLALLTGGRWQARQARQARAGESRRGQARAGEADEGRVWGVCAAAGALTSR